MKLIYKMLVSVVCMNISTQLFCMKFEAQTYIENCVNVDNVCEQNLKKLCTHSYKIDLDEKIKSVNLETDKLKESLTYRQSRRCFRTKQKYNISDDAWNLSIGLAHARMSASFLPANEYCLSWSKFTEKYNFMCEDEIDPVFAQILQNTFLRESINPAKFRLCVSEDVSYEVKTVQVACITGEQGCTSYQETGYGLIVINPFLVKRLSCRLQKGFSLFLASCVAYNNVDYLSDIEVMSNVTIQNKDAIGGLIHQTFLLLVALRDQKSSMLLKELLRNRNMFFDDCDGAVSYYKKMCEVNNCHRYLAWLNKLSDESSEKQLVMNKLYNSTKKGKSVQYNKVEKK
jgi:hypothetical protein